MHPYCMKLHVEEEGDKLRRNATLFSQEEVWKYERPTEESDEEINVVSDDEVTLQETKEEGKGDKVSDNGKLLKSALLNGNSSKDSPSREKKRVSFGLVQVASFDESVEEGFNKKNLTSRTVSALLNNTKALESPAGSALEPQTPSSEMNSNKDEVQPAKGETKAKSLSLQQYRQMRQKRQPLVEKQGNYTTKWPSVSEPPKELTPILCLQGQNSPGPKTAHRYPDSRRGGADQLHRSQTPANKTHHTSALPRLQQPPPLHRTGLKRPRTESKMISPASPLPDVTVNPSVSPVKKLALLSSDPPNPVLLPLPVSQTSSPSTEDSSSESKEELNRDSNLNSTRHFQETQNESSGMSLQPQPSSVGRKPEVLSVNQDSTTPFQEVKIRFTKTASGSSTLCPTATRTQPSSEGQVLQPQNCNPTLMKETKPETKTPLSPSQVIAPIPIKETLPEVPTSKSQPEEPLPTIQFGCRVQSATADSGKLLRHCLHFFY